MRWRQGGARACPRLWMPGALDGGEREEEEARGARDSTSMEQWSTLSLIATLSRQNSTLYFMLAKSPPTLAARWITCLGLYLSKMALVAARSLRTRARRRARLSGFAYNFHFAASHFKSPSLELK